MNLSVMKAITLTLLLMSSPLCFAGTSDGGGGVGVRCPVLNGGTFLETLDVHEAKLRSFKITNIPQSKEDAIELSSHLLAYHYFSGVFKYVDQYKDFLRKRFVEKMFNGEPIPPFDDGKWIYQKDVEKLELSNDYGKYLLDPKCNLVQIAYFDDDISTLLINKKLFNQMNFLNQAVLMTHEIIYFLDRNYPSLHDDFDPKTPRTSEVSRFFVGKLFSTTPPMSKLRSSEKTPHIICENDSTNVYQMTEFRVYPNADGSFSLLSNDLNGFTSPFRFSSQIGFDPGDLVKMNSQISHEGEFVVSDFKTADKYTYQIIKKAFENPFVSFFKNGVPLGKGEEVSCIGSN